MSNFFEPVGFQRNVYEELVACARDYFDGCWDALPVKPRIAPLICGSTGVGKTFLVRKLASELNMPLFAESVSDWILLGCNHRAAPPTLPRLYRFIARNERGVIFFDEIEKLGGEIDATDWRRFLQMELFGALDRTISPGVLEDDEAPKFLLDAEELTERFKRGFLVVGAGAWQTLWQRSAASIGFGDDCHVMSSPRHAQLAATLRVEILNRFSSRVLLMPPLRREDYLAAFSEIIERVPSNVREVLKVPNEDIIQEAVETQKGFRFFEELLAKAIRLIRVAKEGASPAPDGPSAPASADPQPI